ncbi:MAG: hypothetical protein ACRDOH_28725 [Streptosporangiaceae bacterium]
MADAGLIIPSAIDQSEPSGRSTADGMVREAGLRKGIFAQQSSTFAVPVGDAVRKRICKRDVAELAEPGETRQAWRDEQLT